MAKLANATLAGAVGVRGCRDQGRCLQLPPSTSWAQGRVGEMEKSQAGHWVGTSTAPLTHIKGPQPRSEQPGAFPPLHLDYPNISRVS